MIIIIVIVIIITGLKAETEGFILAVQDQCFPTRNFQANSYAMEETTNVISAMRELRPSTTLYLVAPNMQQQSYS